MTIIQKVVLLENFTDKLGRIYNEADLISNTYGKKFYGEIQSISSDLAINLIRVSHTIDNIVVANNNLIGDITILETPSGKILQGLIDVGANLITSIRATGIVNDYKKVTNVKLVTFDIDGHR